MGHEIGHVIARHGAERMSEAMVIAGVGALGAVVVDNKYDAQTRNLFLLAYGGATTVGSDPPAFAPERERSGSHGGRVRRKGRLRPARRNRFWQKMQKQGEAKGGTKMPTLLSTHPAERQAHRGFAGAHARGRTGLRGESRSFSAVSGHFCGWRRIGFSITVAGCSIPLKS